MSKHLNEAAPGARNLAFFDLDFTLIPHDTLLLFCNYVIKRSPSRILYLCLAAPLLPLALIKLLHSREIKRVFLCFLWRLRRERLEELAEGFVRDVVKPAFYPEIRAILDEHRARGDFVILNTASPEFYVRFIATELKCDAFCATKALVEDVMPLIPEIEGPNNKRFAKLVAMRHLLPAEQRALIPERLPAPAPVHLTPVKNSIAYSDSPADLPMLRLAEHVKLVNPISSRLKSEAKEKGWEILRPKTPYAGTPGRLFNMALQAMGLY